MKYKISQIKKLYFKNKKMNDNEIVFIFQYNFNELLYLNLENSNITNEGLIGLQNESLANIKYLNLSKNKISDEGLKYLNYLKNLKDLILLNMNLSDNCFLILGKLYFTDK